MKKPNFFIVGAARSGTTSLWAYLKCHPQVFMPADELFKEPTYFSHDCGQRFDLNSYLALFDEANPMQKWLGEASVAYLTDPESAQRIYDFAPSAKIIILLRNPADRAYSLYNWMVQDGYEYAPSFEEALKLEESRFIDKRAHWFKPNYYWGYLYYRSGLYCNQVKKYLDLFKENVLIIPFEDLAMNPAPAYEKVCSFLNIPPAQVPFHIFNSSRAVYSPKLTFVLRKLNNYILNEKKMGKPFSDIHHSIKDHYTEIVDKLSLVIGFRMYEKIIGAIILRKVTAHLRDLSLNHPHHINNTKEVRDWLLNFGLKAGPPPPIKNKTRIRLLLQYACDVEKLSQLTRMDFSPWLF